MQKLPQEVNKKIWGHKMMVQKRRRKWYHFLKDHFGAKKMVAKFENGEENGIIFII